MELTPAIWPPEERCTDTALPAAFVDPPARFVEPAWEFRLIQPLRWAAKLKDPRKILAYATAAFYRAQHPTASSSAKNDIELGNALADLSVTGRAAYTAFQSLSPIEAAVLEQLTSGLLSFMTEAIPAGNILNGLLATIPPGPTPATFATAITSALDRAYDVAWALRGPLAYREKARAPLGWIAVSGEDDKPHRPVNVPQSSYEQFEIPVTVAVGPTGATHNVTIQTRFLIASAIKDPVPVTIRPSRRVLPPDPVPHIPEGHYVILFLHGHSSGAEEAGPIIPHLHTAGLAKDKQFAIVSIDLPNNGYSETFDHTTVAPLSGTKYPASPQDSGPIVTPILDYIEDFVVAFVNALENKTRFKDRFAGVIGGSLGGNLGLRLGRRDPATCPWLTNAGIVSWSAASVWAPMVQDFIKSQGPGRCFERTAIPEAEGSRSDFFTQSFGQEAFFLVSQPDQWYREGWECKPIILKAVRIARREIYHANFRQWHFRVAGEQLIYSHFDGVNHQDSASPPRYQSNKVRELLVAGDKDEHIGAHIYSNTRLLAQRMTQTPGRSLFLRNTGHSIHIERPIYFAGQIADFLQAPRRTDISFLTPLLLSEPKLAARASADVSYLTPLLLSGPG